jgi:hypothetical protein
LSDYIMSHSTIEPKIEGRIVYVSEWLFSPLDKLMGVIILFI